MTDLNIIGIDPGLTCGVILVRFEGYGRSYVLDTYPAQVPPASLWALIAGWVEAYDISAVAVERFVVLHRAGRARTPQGGQAARDLQAQLRLAVPPGLLMVERAAAQVKPWATDRRLEVAGLLEPTRGMRHARDAARHALYCAVRDFHRRDPLSRKAVKA